jgi:Domain of unknown function (DUF4124)
MRTALILLGVLLAAAASATTYKWVDNKGVTHYSDRPEPGAEIVDLRPAQTFDAPAPAGAQRPQARDQEATDAVRYQLDVWKPENNETFQNTGNIVPVRLRLEPDLQDGHAIWVYMDGKRVDGLAAGGTSFDVPNVERGTHTLTVVVADLSGKTIVSSPSITFHLHQQSLLAPNRVRPTPR